MTLHRLCKASILTGGIELRQNSVSLLGLIRDLSETCEVYKCKFHLIIKILIICFFAMFSVDRNY